MSARLWRCDRCGKSDHWGPGWEWFGSIEPGPEYVVCSPECKAAAQGDPGCRPLAIARLQSINYGKRVRS